MSVGIPGALPRPAWLARPAATRYTVPSRPITILHSGPGRSLRPLMHILRVGALLLRNADRPVAVWCQITPLTAIRSRPAYPRVAHPAVSTTVRPAARSTVAILDSFTVPLSYAASWVEAVVCPARYGLPADQYTRRPQQPLQHTAAGAP